MSNIQSPLIAKIIEAIRDNQLDSNHLLLQETIRQDVENKNSIFQIGLACAQNNRSSDARIIFEELQLNNQDDSRIPFNLALIRAMQGDLLGAIAAYDLALIINPEDPDILINKGALLNDLNNYKVALEVLECAIALKRDIPEAWLNKGVALNHLERYQEAIDSYDEAIKLSPASFEAWSNRSIPLKNLRQYVQACESCDKALSYQPDYSMAWFNKADTLHDLKKYEDALICYERALVYRPDHAEAWANKAVLLYSLKRYEDAISCYDKALSFKPDHFEAWSNKGATLLMLKRHEEALSCFENALSDAPQYPEAWANKAVALQMLKHYEEASACYDKALAYKTDIDWAFGDALHLKLKLGMWKNLQESIELLKNKLRSHEKAITPFSALSLIDDSTLHFKVAKTYAHEKFPYNPALGSLVKEYKNKKIRLGYFSGDFCEHPVSYLTAELFELHDRDLFEIYAFSLEQAPATDFMRSRLTNAFDLFIDVSSMSDIEVARYARKLGVDIAIDLSGLTEDSRTGIFSYRAAPIQVNYLGYPGTTGTDFMDYIIADEVVIPEKSRELYTEKVAYLPDTYMVDDSSRVPSQKLFARSEFGLPEKGFVFCCFNNSYKFNSEVIQSWARILSRVSNSVLWLSENNATFRKNLHNEFEKLGINSQRVIFAAKVDPMEDHLTRIALADLFLDTSPYNAHTTALDALKAGVPVLTKNGDAFAGRVAASLLKAIEIPELVTHTLQEYENLAIELALNPQKLIEIKGRLSRNRLSGPLFNTPLFAKNLEKLFMRMHERCVHDLPPDHLLKN
ncbi:tetratricopeptide repeat protein [Polynucleobacter ibericus]|uniref:tetratricopeptide repeat protein n=1 Tax=Polynucleobacter ibericus TaxID=1819725 RepID=UPI001BFE235B|nr:glycosyltransferase family 41 protein [Polynucleobacter ibericus]QWE08416.1 tetratricopeptide repeat protein [Polynucleobacter ibericus]